MSFFNSLDNVFDKVDEYLLDRHTEIAHLANDLFGVSNYTLSNCTSTIPFFTFSAYELHKITLGKFDDTAQIGLFWLGISGLYAANRIYRNIKNSNKVELSDSMAIDQEKQTARQHRALYLSGSLLFFSFYFYRIASPLITAFSYDDRLFDASLFGSYFGMTVSEYFSGVDHTPAKRSRIRQAFESLYLRPELQKSN